MLSKPIPQDFTGTESLHYSWRAEQCAGPNTLPTKKHVEYMTFPRLPALAEVTWSREGRAILKISTRQLKIRANERLDSRQYVNYRLYARQNGRGANRFGISAKKPKGLVTNDVTQPVAFCISPSAVPAVFVSSQVAHTVSIKPIRSHSRRRPRLWRPRHDIMVRPRFRRPVVSTGLAGEFCASPKRTPQSATCAVA